MERGGKEEAVEEWEDTTMRLTGKKFYACLQSLYSFSPHTFLLLLRIIGYTTRWSANVLAKDNEGRTAAHLAAEQGRVDILRALALHDITVLCAKSNAVIRGVLFLLYM